jgi:hypothetical protein
MTDGLKTGESASRPWSACPNCFIDLRPTRLERRPLHTHCPFCGAEITFIWWQRVIVSILGLILTYAIPALLGFRGGVTLIFAGVLTVFPSLVLAVILVFKTIPPKYVSKPGVPISLFQRKVSNSR